MSTTFYVNVSTLTYLKDPLKTFASALFLSFDQNTGQKKHQDSLTQQPATSNKEGSNGHKTTPFSSVWGVLI
jgi:hypothetical protein